MLPQRWILTSSVDLPDRPVCRIIMALLNVRNCCMVLDRTDGSEESVRGTSRTIWPWFDVVPSAPDNRHSNFNAGFR